MEIRFFLLVIFFNVVQLVSGQHFFYGKIVSSEGEGIENCIVKIDQLRHQTTDKSGYFSLESLEEGEHEIAIRKMGYKDTIIQFLIPHASPLNVVLKKTEIHLKEVAIDSKRISEDGSVSTMRMIEGFTLSEGKKNEVVLVENLLANKAVNNTRQIYASVPGLVVWESDAAGIQLGVGGRGLNPNRTSNFNVRQNGYDISADPLGYPESYYSPPSELIEKIQLIRGASSLQFGPHFGGMLNFKLKKGAKDKKISGEIRQTIGSNKLSNTFVFLGGSTKGWNYSTFFQKKKGEDFRPNGAFDVNTFGLNVSKQFLEDKFRVNMDITKMSYLNQQPGGVTDKQFEEDPFVSNRSRNWFAVDWNLASLSGEYKVTNKAKVQSRFFGLVASRKALGYLGPINRIDPLNERNLIVGDFQNIGNESRFIYKYKIRDRRMVLLAGYRFFSGTNLSSQGVASKEDGPDFDFIKEGIQSDYRFPNLNHAAFIEHTFSVSKKWRITPGVRWENILTKSNGQYRVQATDLTGSTILDTLLYDNIDNQRSFFLLGIGVTYQLKNNWQIYMNGSQNYKSVTFSDMQINNPSFQIDPNLKDETGYNVDIGIRSFRNKKIQLDGSVFQLFYRDRIGTVLNFDQKTYRTFQYRTNISDAVIRGVESFVSFLFVDKSCGSDKKLQIRSFVNFSLMSAEYITSQESAYRGKKVEMVSPIILKNGLQLKYGDISTSIQYSYTAAQYSDATNSEKVSSAIIGIIPSYQVWDISLKYSRKNISVNTGINNFLNERYFTRRATGYPGPGIIPSAPRMWYFGVNVQF